MTFPYLVSHCTPIVVILVATTLLLSCHSQQNLTFFLMTLFSQHTHLSKYAGVLILKAYVSLLWAFLTNIP